MDNMNVYFVTKDSIILVVFSIIDSSFALTTKLYFKTTFYLIRFQ